MAVADQRRGLLTLSAAAFAVLMGLTMSRAIGRPLSLLRQAEVAMGHGRLDTKVTVRSRDEIGVLANTLSQMASDLQETMVARSYLDNIIQSMREMLIVTDSDWCIRRVNRAAWEEVAHTAGAHHHLHPDLLAARDTDRLAVERPPEGRRLAAAAAAPDCGGRLFAHREGRCELRHRRRRRSRGFRLPRRRHPGPRRFDR